MKAVDTNILVRFLTQDDPSLAKRVSHVLDRAERDGEPLYVPQAVILELLWVLGSHYRYSRDDVLDALAHLLEMSVLEFESRSLLIAWLQIARVTKMDYADILIALQARERGCEATLTFDRKAAKSDLFEMLGR